MISRTLEKLGVQSEGNIEGTFADKNKVSDYAKDSVAYIKSIELTKGHNNEFRPLDNLTRSEAAKVISKLMKIINS